MRSFIYGSVYSRRYTFGTNFGVNADFSAKHMIWNTPDMSLTGYIITDDVFIEYKELTELSICREFNRNDLIMIDGKDYKIESKSFNIDGDIVYRINHVEYIEDEESKLNAETELKMRDAYIQGRAERLEYDHSNVAANMTKGEPADNYQELITTSFVRSLIDRLVKLEEKKWYQFWK